MPTSLRGLWMSNEAAAQCLAVLFWICGAQRAYRWTAEKWSILQREISIDVLVLLTFLKPLFKSAGDECLILKIDSGWSITLSNLLSQSGGLKRALEGWMVLVLRCAQTWFDLVKFDLVVVWQKAGETGGSVGAVVSINCRNQHANNSIPQSYKLSIFCHYLCHCLEMKKLLFIIRFSTTLHYQAAASLSHSFWSLNFH